MNNFSFYNPTRIFFGEGQIAKLTQAIPADARVLVLYGGGSIKKNGVYQQVSQALAEHTWFEFGGIEPNPGFHTLCKAVEVVKQEKIDFLLAVGGGSVADGTKFIAAAACFEGDPWDILAHKAKIQQALPLGVVLTLPATGSESNPNGVITNYQTQDKLSFFSAALYPQFAILDPTTTYSLPPKQVANGIVDAFVHTVEQYVTSPHGAQIQDYMAEGILRTLIQAGPQALQHPQDYQVRANVMWAATMALNGLIGCGVPQDWATHMIGHELTALHGLDHGQTLAVVLPAEWQVMREQKAQKLLQYGARVWGIQTGDEQTRIDQSIAKTREFFESLGIATRLSDYGIGADEIDTLVKALEKHGMTALGEQRNIDLQTSRAILQAAL